jgi:putative methyltransferase (TIGR04325 family)
MLKGQKASQNTYSLPEYIWEGIYRNLQDVPTAGKGHDGDWWVNATIANTQNAIAASSLSPTVPKHIVDEHILLPMLASIVCESKDEISILDFGGGMGIAYVHLLSSMMRAVHINYHIVEVERICREGLKLFGPNDSIDFNTSLPNKHWELDIIYIDSVLQYIDDYPGFIKSICSYRPKYIMFVKLAAGDIPTYATAQKNIPGSTIACWFFNIKELIETICDQGYSLIFKSALARDYDQSNFPKQYRLGRMSNLLFSRRSAGLVFESTRPP